LTAIIFKLLLLGLFAEQFQKLDWFYKLGRINLLLLIFYLKLFV